MGVRGNGVLVPPRCQEIWSHGADGCSASVVVASWRAISVPWSQVIDHSSAAGTDRGICGKRWRRCAPVCLEGLVVARREGGAEALAKSPESLDRAAWRSCAHSTRHGASPISTRSL